MASTVRAEKLEASIDEGLSTLVRSAMEALSLLLPGRVVAIYVEQLLSQPALARVLPERSVPMPGDYTLELRLASWLGGNEDAEVRIVPTFLMPWLSAVRALVVPLMIGGYRRGAIIVEASKLGRKELDILAQLERDLSGRLAALERTLPRGVQSERVRFECSMRRIKTLT